MRLSTSLALHGGLTTNYVTGTYSEVEVQTVTDKFHFDRRFANTEHSFLESLLNCLGSDAVLAEIPTLRLIAVPEGAVSLENKYHGTTHSSPVNITPNTLDRSFCAAILRPRFGILPFGLTPRAA